MGACALCTHPVDDHLESDGPCRFIVRYIYGTAQMCPCPRVIREEEIE